MYCPSNLQTPFKFIIIRPCNFKNKPTLLEIFICKTVSAETSRIKSLL